MAAMLGHPYMYVLEMYVFTLTFINALWPESYAILACCTRLHQTITMSLNPMHSQETVVSFHVHLRSMSLLPHILPLQSAATSLPSL